jgi:hypothetical protein
VEANGGWDIKDRSLHFTSKSNAGVCEVVANVVGMQRQGMWSGECVGGM